MELIFIIVYGSTKKLDNSDYISLFSHWNRCFLITVLQNACQSNKIKFSTSFIMQVIRKLAPIIFYLMISSF
jgi:hypothetical protein